MCSVNKYLPTLTVHHPEGSKTAWMSGGFPHSEIPGSKGALASPGLIAECHVLHRLLPPRHPPNALIALDPSRKTTGVIRRSPKSHPRPAWFFHHVPYGSWDKLALELHASTVSILDLERVDPDPDHAVRRDPSYQGSISSLFTMSIRPRIALGDAKGPNELDDADLRQASELVEPAGIEPATLCLQSRCSPS